MCNHVICKYRQFSFFLFISGRPCFLSLVALGRAPGTVLNGSSLPPDVGGKFHRFALLGVMLAASLS